MKRDVKQFRDFSKAKGCGIDERSRFRKFLEDKKLAGEGGSASTRGDYTWEELESAYQEFLEIG